MQQKPKKLFWERGNLLSSKKRQNQIFFDKIIFLKNLAISIFIGYNININLTLTFRQFALKT